MNVLSTRMIHAALIGVVALSLAACVGSANVRAEKSLRANVSGVGSLSWKGAATDVTTNVSGIGRVSKG